MNTVCRMVKIRMVKILYSVERKLQQSTVERKPSILNVTSNVHYIAHSSESRICWAQKSDPKVCADAELSQAVHRGERRVDADRHRYRTPADVEVIKVKVVLKE